MIKKKKKDEEELAPFSVFLLLTFQKMLQPNERYNLYFMQYSSLS